MSDVTLSGAVPAFDSPRLDHPVTPLAIFGFLAVVAAGLLFVAYSIYVDVDATQARITSFVPYALLAVALIIALGFEFVNGFHDTANAVATVIYTHSLPAPFAAVTKYISSHEINGGTYPSLAALVRDIANQVEGYGSLAKIPATDVGNTRNDMYLASEAVRLLAKDKAAELSAPELAKLGAYKTELDASTKFIPLWVKIAVAVALGLGTMIGWKRIVVTVGEKIGKTHLTYAQGAAAELVAMGTILAADNYGLPVSTTHVLSSGVAGTMAANGSGLQVQTVRNLVMAWVLTLPAAMLISGFLYFVFSKLF
jgi:inorganic phosphate transporter, PiT family